MSTTRSGDRVSSARHNHPLSPFARAREPNYEFDLETSNFPTPSKQDGPRSRPNYRTSTLAGAYRAASRASMEEGLHSGSPRQRQEALNMRSPSSESNSPNEYNDTHRRMHTERKFGDYVPSDGGDPPTFGARSSSRASRTSSRFREQDYHQQYHDGLALSDAPTLDGAGHLSPRRRTTSYTRDEQRLRRVTGKDSPVFSKAKVGARASLTADNLQRREYEESRQQPPVSEDEGEFDQFGPSLNLPSAWGSRAKRNHDQWLRKSSQNSFSDSQEGGEHSTQIEASRAATKAEELSIPDSLRSPQRSRLPARTALGESTANAYMGDSHEFHLDNKITGLDQNAPPEEGDAIPNTPVIVYKNSSISKPETARREPLQLLRKLSRTDSPIADQVKTPEPPKLFERKIYDQTPRVTGAWIDTPMTEKVVDKVTELPSDLTKDIVAPPAPEKLEPPAQQAKPAEAKQAKVEEVREMHEKSTTNDSPKEPAKPFTSSQPRPAVTKPKLPKSALETVIEDVNSGKDSLDFDVGDDTLESLQAIMDDPTEPKTEAEEEAYEKAVLNKLEQARANGQSSVDLDRLNDKLASLANHISDVKYGLNNLEGHFTQGAKIPHQPSSQIQLIAPDTSSTETRGNFVHWDELPRLWSRDPVSGRLQITTIGRITLVSLIWYVVECTMNEQFCQPIYTANRGSYCLQTDAPQFPLVTVTMLWRWSHISTLLAPIITLSVAVFRFVAQLLGMWDGFVDEPPQLGKLVGEVRINGTPVPFPWLASPSAHTTTASIVPQPQPTVFTAHKEAPVKWEDDQPSMDDDEYL